jgi:hypothetical protein
LGTVLKICFDKPKKQKFTDEKVFFMTLYVKKRSSWTKYIVQYSRERESAPSASKYEKKISGSVFSSSDPN